MKRARFIVGRLVGCAFGVLVARSLVACNSPPLIAQVRASGGGVWASPLADPPIRPSAGGRVRFGVGSDRGGVVVGVGGDWEKGGGTYRMELTGLLLPRWTPISPPSPDSALRPVGAWQTSVGPSRLGGELGLEWGSRYLDGTSGFFIGAHAGPLVRVGLSPQRHEQFLLGLHGAFGYQRLDQEPGVYATLNLSFTWHHAWSVF